jgi:uncharacterized membrane protein (DUF2068 family)
MLAIQGPTGANRESPKRSCDALSCTELASNGGSVDPNNWGMDMKSSQSGLIRLIAIFKLLKASLLIVVGVGALKLFHHGGYGAMEHWVTKLGVNPGGRYVDQAISKVANIPPSKLKDFGLGSFVYAVLFLTEGIGLWLMKTWAEWFTVLITASLVPLEIYEIHHRPTIPKMVVFAINVAVVVYLLFRIRKERSSTN